MLTPEQKEKLMPILKHFGFMVGAMAVGVLIQTGNEYLIPALKTAFPESRFFVPAVTTGFGMLATLYAKSPIKGKG